MNKRWFCLKPEQIQFAVIGSLSLKNLFFFAVKEGHLTEHLHAHSILLIPMRNQTGRVFSNRWTFCRVGSFCITDFESPIVLTVFCT